MDIKVPKLEIKKRRKIRQYQSVSIIAGGVHIHLEIVDVESAGITIFITDLLGDAKMYFWLLIVWLIGFVRYYRVIKDSSTPSELITDYVIVAIVAGLWPLLFVLTLIDVIINDVFK